jgi:hypothetical protein
LPIETTEVLCTYLPTLTVVTLLSLFPNIISNKARN